VTDRPAAAPTIPPVPTLEKVRMDNIARDVSHEFLNELVGLFLTDVAKRLEGLSDAVRDRKMDNALASAHVLKGAAASLGVLRLREVAGKLEDYLERGDWRAVDAMHVRLLREFAHVRSVLGRGGDSSDAASAPDAKAKPEAPAAIEPPKAPAAG
jgi:HPt (histidine-containing phosphotransfer) domain-containing protein